MLTYSFAQGWVARAGALFSDVSGAGAIKIFGSSSSYPIIENMQLWYCNSTDFLDAFQFYVH